MTNKAFTLLEVMVVVIIIGILATVALPSYTRYKEQAVDKEAIQGLKLIDAAEKIYKVEQGNYVQCNDTSDCNNKLKTALSDKNWSFIIVLGAAPNDYIATCSRNSPPSEYDRSWQLKIGKGQEPICIGSGGGKCP